MLGALKEGRKIVVKILLSLSFITSLPGGMQSIVMSMSVCLFVCVSVRWHISETTPNVLCMYSAVRWLCEMLCTSGFVDDVVFLSCFYGDHFLSSIFYRI